MKNLAEYRKDRNMTQRELSEITGIPFSSIAMYETGKRIPSLTRARKIADFFKVSTDEISFGIKKQKK